MISILLDKDRLSGPAILKNILKTAALLAVAALVCELLYRLGFAAQNIIIVMVLAVFIVAVITDGLFYGLAATLVGAFIYDYLVTEPRLGFSVTAGYPVTLSIMTAVTLITSAVTARIKRQARDSRLYEKRAELLYDINRTLLSSRDSESVAAHSAEYLAGELGRSCALFLPADGSRSFFCGADGDTDSGFPPPELDSLDIVGPPKGWARGGVYYHPIEASDRIFGVFAISLRHGKISDREMDFLLLITDQTAQALVVQDLSARQQESIVAAETEKARNSFLRGISHDLRTPLTSIIGASATFLESGDLSPAVQHQLISGIHEDSQWLLSMVENILSVTRIHQSGMVIKKSDEMAEEIVAQTVSAFRKRFPEAVITIKQSDDIMFVPMDPLLITQVITNLLDNSQRHSGGMKSMVTISMRERGGFAEFSVSDTGPGIEPEKLPYIFEMRSPMDGGEDSSRGLGMGLAICKTVLEAHGGEIRAENNPGGGALMRFTLPL